MDQIGNSITRNGCIWIGDANSDIDHFKTSIHMLLNISMAGISFCGSDIPGFVGNPPDELVVRWYQVGVFIPFFRAHCCINFNRREPYLYKGDTFKLVRNSLLQRYSLLSYIYTCFYQSYKSNAPLMIPMWYYYPEDSCYESEYQFMLGDKLMVCPITDLDATKMEVYIPLASDWYDFNTKLWIDAKGKQQIALSKEHLPVYIKAGSILPLKLLYCSTTYEYSQLSFDLEIYVDSNQSAKGNIYIDDGNTTDFEKTHDLIECQFKNDTLTITPLHCEYHSKEHIRCILVYGAKKAYKEATITSSTGTSTHQVEGNIVDIGKTKATISELLSIKLH